MQHTAEAFGKQREFALNTLRENNGYDAAAFVIQVAYDEDVDGELSARDVVTRMLRNAGFKHVDSSGARAAFDFVPGSWGSFRHIAYEVARVNGVTLERVLLCFAPLGMCFRYPEDGFD